MTVPQFLPSGLTEKQIPFVSVIMPIRNEGAFIARSLSAVLTQDYPSDHYEVLIADGLSTDSTRVVINETIAANLHGPSVCIIDNPRRIVPTGFNLALAQSHGEIIVRVDGHTIIAPDYLRQCVALLLNTDASNVGGRMVAVGSTSLSKAIALATSSPFGVGGARFHYSTREELVDTVYMGAWHRRTFDTLGGFDERFVRNQDDEFNFRLRAAGGKILLSPTIKSEYFNRSTLGSLWKQYFEYGLYKVRVVQKHPMQMSVRQFVPAALVLSLVLSLLAGFIIPVGRLCLFAVLCLYFVANMAASLITAQTWEQRFYLPLIFSILHFAYGTGFLIGIIKWFPFWKSNHDPA
jgi:succinoglycan biosynthesis protein ExoA